MPKVIAELVYVLFKLYNVPRKEINVTFNQKDKISYGGMIIEVVPAVEFFTKK